jgi:hypothetical protein
MRHSLLDTQLAPYNRSPQPTTVIRMEIQTRNALGRGQRDGQLQLCVPLVGATIPRCNSLSRTAAAIIGSANRSAQVAIPA